MKWKGWGLKDEIIVSARVNTTTIHYCDICKFYINVSWCGVSLFQKWGFNPDRRRSPTDVLLPLARLTRVWNWSLRWEYHYSRRPALHTAKYHQSTAGAATRTRDFYLPWQALITNLGVEWLGLTGDWRWHWVAVLVSIAIYPGLEWTSTQSQPSHSVVVAAPLDSRLQ